MNITHDQAIDIAENTAQGWISDAPEIRTDYSGRGMYGETCLAFDLSSEGQLAYLFIAATEELGVDGARDLASKLRTDSMGTGIIAYFPGVSVVDVEAEVTP